MAGAGTIAPLNKASAELKKYKANSSRKLPPAELSEIKLD